MTITAKLFAAGLVVGLGYNAGQDLWGWFTGLVGLCYG